jgi:primosomal protein N' (replication factor Y)
MKKLLSISVVSYPGKAPKLFGYYDLDDCNTMVGQVVKVSFGNKETLGVVMETPAADDSNDRPTANTLTIAGRLEAKPLPAHILKLASWMMEYYAASASSVWRTILPSGLAQAPKLKSVTKDSEHPEQVITLNGDQEQALARILKRDYAGYLLHGITGSGKTEVYIELIKKVIAEGKSAIVLVPEIALTPQMLERLGVHFGDRLVVSHSKLTPARRKKIWHEALATERAAGVFRPTVGPVPAYSQPWSNHCR